MNILETFRVGNGVGENNPIKGRILPEFKEPPRGLHLNLGAGKKMIPREFLYEEEECIPLDAEHGWMAGQRMPLDDDTVAQVYSFHFFEHLRKEEIIGTLRELERVLMPGGLVNMLVPHWSCELAHQDLDHKSFWGETSLRMLLEDKSYDGTMPRDWRLKINSVLIIGIAERNLVTLYQLEKEE